MLRQSIPVFLEEEPAWDIYTDGLETRDPAGVALRGLASYQVRAGSDAGAGRFAPVAAVCRDPSSAVPAPGANLFLDVRISKDRARHAKQTSRRHLCGVVPSRRARARHGPDRLGRTERTEKTTGLWRRFKRHANDCFCL